MEQISEGILRLDKNEFAVCFARTLLWHFLIKCTKISMSFGLNDSSDQEMCFTWVTLIQVIKCLYIRLFILLCNDLARKTKIHIFSKILSWGSWRLKRLLQGDTAEAQSHCRWHRVWYSFHFSLGPLWDKIGLDMPKGSFSVSCFFFKEKEFKGNTSIELIEFPMMIDVFYVGS